MSRDVLIHIFDILYFEILLMLNMFHMLIRAALTGVLKQRDSEGPGHSCFNSVEFHF